MGIPDYWKVKKEWLPIYKEKTSANNDAYLDRILEDTKFSSHTKSLRRYFYKGDEAFGWRQYEYGEGRDGFPFARTIGASKNWLLWAKIVFPELKEYFQKGIALKIMNGIYNGQKPSYYYDELFDEGEAKESFKRSLKPSTVSDWGRAVILIDEAR